MAKLEIRKRPGWLFELHTDSAIVSLRGAPFRYLYATEFEDPRMLVRRMCALGTQVEVVYRGLAGKDARGRLLDSTFRFLSRIVEKWEERREGKSK